MGYPALTFPHLPTDDITPLVMSAEVRTVEQFNAAAMELFVVAREIQAEHRLRALAAIANGHGLTYGELVDAVGQKVRQLVREDLKSSQPDDLPDTEIVRAIMSA